MSQFFKYPPVTITATNPSVGLNGSPAPTSSTEIGGIGPTGNEVAITVNADGSLTTPPAINVTGSLSALGTLITQDCLKQQSASVQISGVFVGIVTFQTSNDNIIWNNAAMMPAGDLTSIITSTATAPGIYTTQLNSRYFRVQVTSYTSGTINANAYFKTYGNSPNSIGGYVSAQIRDSNGAAINLGSTTGANSVPVIIASDQVLPLPTNAAQETGGHLASIDTKVPALGQALAAGSVPVVLTASQLTTLTPLSSVTVTQATASNLNAVVTQGPAGATAWKVDGSAVTQPISAASLPLPSGAATSALQTTLSGQLPTTLGAKTTANSLSVNIASDQVVPISGTVTATNTANGATGAAVPAQATQVAGSDGTNLRALKVSATGVVSVDGSAVTQPISSSALTTIAANTPAVGQAVMASSSPVVIASDQSILSTISPDILVTGAAAQTATVNNILTVASGAAATDLAGYKAASVQVNSTGTAGTYIFEGSNDNVNFVAVPVFNQVILTGTPITAAVTASATNIIYTMSLHYRYLRLRIVTTITGGSIQAISKFSQNTWTPSVFTIANATAANANVTATIASGTVTTVTTVAAVTSANLGIGSAITDVASAALTTTTTTAAFTPTFGTSYEIQIPVTAVSGTLPTLDVQVQESPDGGTNWSTVYTFPRITATGSYMSPPIQLMGNRVRYVQTVAGTTPSFTRAVNRLQMSVPSQAKVSGKSQANPPIQNLYGTTSVTSAAYVQLVASTVSNTTELEIFDSSGVTLKLAVGAAGFEIDQIYIFPGGNGRVPLYVPAGSRISIKALSTSATSGEIDINFYN